MDAAEVLDSGLITEMLPNALELSMHDSVNEQAQRQTGANTVSTPWANRQTTVLK